MQLVPVAVEGRNEAWMTKALDVGVDRLIVGKDMEGAGDDAGPPEPPKRGRGKKK